MITLTLLHPMQSIPVQSWNFEHESVIRIGRSTDNHVILYSAVVSRHHVEIRKAETGWEIVNLGANGTYLDGRRITQVPVEDGVVIRLARSGPNVQIHLDAKGLENSRALVGEQTVGQSKKAVANSPLTEAASSRPTAVQVDDDGLPYPLDGTTTGLELSECCQQYLNSEHVFCLECGKPLKTIGQVDHYALLKELEQDEVSVSYLGWRAGKTVILKTLLPQWADQFEAVEQFEQDARQWLTLAHPALPTFLEVLVEREQPYLVMTPTYGRSLEQIVTHDGALPVKTAIAYLLQVCDLLGYLHSQNPPILHQRLKPAHIIQRTNPATPLLITGLTPAAGMAPRTEATGYSAPEQQHAQACTASDWYALGPILVYFVTGKSPDTFYAQREQGFRFYAEYVPGLTADLVAIVRKLTNPQPSERYTTLQELTTDLQQVAAVNL